MQKVLIYLLLAILTFVTFQWAILYVQGPDRTFQSIYRTQPVTRVLAPLKLEKTEKRETLDCVPIQVIVDKASLDSTKNQKDTAGVQDAGPFQTLPQKQSGPDYQPLPPQSNSQSREFPYLLNRFRLRAPILDAQLLEFYLQEDGSTTLSQTPDPSSFSLGRLREIGLWMGPSFHSLELGSEENLQNGLDYSFDLSYQQDLFKVGPTWTRFRIEGGYDTTLKFNGRAQLGIPIFRF